MTPYNINLSPFVDRALDVNRDWTFMSWCKLILGVEWFPSGG